MRQRKDATAADDRTDLDGCLLIVVEERMELRRVVGRFR
jgi:hypothetical protein